MMLRKASEFIPEALAEIVRNNVENEAKTEQADAEKIEEKILEGEPND